MFIDSVVSEATGTLRRAAQGVKLSVNQDNVLEAARIIETEVTHFEAQVHERAVDMYVDRLGGDPVSGEVARVLTFKLVGAPDSYVSRCLQYAKMLHDLAQQLRQSAMTYGFTEDVIEAQFNAAKREGEQQPIVVQSRESAHRGRGVI